METFLQPHQRAKMFGLQKTAALILFLLLSCSCIAQTSVTSNIPIFIIDPGGPEIPNDPKIPATFRIAAEVAGSYSYTIGGTNTYQYDGKIGIEIRGNTSAEWPKKSYGFETQDPVTSSSIDVSLLGFPAESDWVLNACYGDKSFIREVLAQEMFRQTGRYASRTKYVELFLNTGGSLRYMGVYIFMEKVKRGKDRLDMKKLGETDTDALKISGGYLLQVGENEDMKWNSNISPNNNASNPKPIFHVEYPKLEKYTNITNRDAQFNYIKNFVNNFEAALNGANANDPLIGYRKYLNVDSMVDYLLLQEFTKNSDNWRASTFFYKQRDDEGGLLNLGGPWDFDKSMGNQQWCYEPSVLPTGTWAWKFNTYCPDRPPLTVSWPEKVLNDCYFVQRVIARYKQLRLNQWSDANVLAFIEAQRTTLKSNNAITRNFTKWNILTTGIMYNEHYTLAGNTHDKEVDYLKTWIQQHLAWMDSDIATISSLTCAPLPVTYNSFEVNKNDNKVLVSWSTTAEQNNGYFEIQRSGDAMKFSKIGMIEGKGESASLVKYEFTDDNPLSGINYYRINQVDRDGTSELTRIKGIEFKTNELTPVLYPNPADNEIHLMDLMPGSKIKIVDVKGRVIQNITVNEKYYNLPLHQFHDQMYYLSVDDGRKIKSFTFLINR
jgi:hypothetical protein